MKKIILFFVFSLIPALADCSFSVNFFDTHLDARINRCDVANEFKDWAIVDQKPMTTVFREVMAESDELQKMYSYFRGPIARTYDTGIDTGCIRICHAVECTKCNVDFIVDLFRKALIKHGSENKTIVSAVPKTQLDLEVNIPVEIDVPAEIASPEVKFQVSPAMEEIEIIVDLDATQEPVTNQQLESIIEQVEHELTFQERLEYAVRSLPEGLTPSHTFDELVYILLESKNNEYIETKKIEELYKDVSEYIQEKVADEKPSNEYTWWERQLCNSPFKFARNMGRKKITKQRVMDADQSWVIAALNIKQIVIKELIKRMQRLNKLALMRELHNERKNTLKLVLDILH